MSKELKDNKSVNINLNLGNKKEINILIENRLDLIENELDIIENKIGINNKKFEDSYIIKDKSISE